MPTKTISSPLFQWYRSGWLLGGVMFVACVSLRGKDHGQSMAAPAASQSTPVAVSVTALGGDTGLIYHTLHPKQGKLSDLVRNDIREAERLGRTPFVEVGATFCGPCKKLEESLNDPQMRDALHGTFIIHINADEWGVPPVLPGPLGPLGYNTWSFPTFLAIDSLGYASGPKLEASWQKNEPASMAPVLKAFFRQYRRQ